MQKINTIIKSKYNAAVSARKLGEILLSKKLKLVTAESCTGGGIAYALTSIPGCSEWFSGGLVVYSNLLKINLLNIDHKIIHHYGAVSKETVIRMAEGALDKTGADVSIAVTGIAGPDGGSAEKPVGTVWFGFKYPQIKTLAFHQQLTGTRAEIRKQSILFALETLSEILTRHA